MRNFYKEQSTGNILTEFSVFSSSGEEVTASKLTANTTDAAQEKHVPVVTIKDNQVDVVIGSVEHPMLEEHYITGIYIETKAGGQFKSLKPGDAPKASFILSDDDSFVAAYEYCNLHGLWKA
ncbi:desulfoferrodoxin family protein [Aequitasia blattaphilus]|uniref:Desulfoferrodoxin family protein n=1 Tax=Aequitasia blattaphilus TaxID=2949332 RepID=A0ABT1E834_9FIRM|nr:desulfoferrodoxin family protein [Aequitasia blattaphilus]MCP1101784.1 desulfoferrodoxin family protein [Aequitasia blattaphilus]MCR8614424.1 desulfoferrodoxin [Aequitasia blattaphilus]